MMITTNKGEQTSDVWYLDTGCSNHMTGHREWLSDFDATKKTQVSLADHSKLTAEGKGTISPVIPGGRPALVKEVFHVPHLKCNLISVGQLVEKGFSVTIDKRGLRLFDPKGKFVLKSVLSKNRTFKANITTSAPQCLLTTSTNQEAYLWHQRYGHLNFKSLSDLRSISMVSGIPKLHVPDRVFSACLAGKQTRLPFVKSIQLRAQHVLDVVSSDICGPFEVLSLGGSKYFITFIDEFSRRIWLYLIKLKSEAFSVFKRFKAEPEKQSDKSLKKFIPSVGVNTPQRSLKNFVRNKGFFMK